MKNYYQILEISEDAPISDIKAAYRKFSKIYHPDANEGNLRFKDIYLDIQEAYKTLSNQNRRILYDHKLKEYKFHASFQKAAPLVPREDQAKTQFTGQQPFPAFKRSYFSALKKYVQRKANTFLVIGVSLLIILPIIFLFFYEDQPSKQPVIESSPSITENLVVESEFQKVYERRLRLWKEYTGEWSGIATGVTLKESFKLQLVCDFEKSIFLVNHESLGFKGKWELLNMDETKAEFEETIETGLPNNVRVGRVELTIIDKNTLDYKYYFPDHKRLMAVGVIRK